MTFEEFKQECIDRQKRLVINQYLHLYIKAASYADIIQLAKRADFLWSFANGVMDMDLINQIPALDLEAANWYQAPVNLNDINYNTIYLFPGAELTLNQTGTNRCKVIMIGGGMAATAYEESMIEVEAYFDSQYTLGVNGHSYAHVTNGQTANATIMASESAIVKVNGRGKSTTFVDLADDSFLNAVIGENSTLTYSPSTNIQILLHEKGTATPTS